MKHFGFTVLILFFLFVDFNKLSAQEGKDLIQSAISDKWANTRYLFYAAIGSSTIPGFNHERTFLIDKKTADCRFEGTNKNNESIVLLFNYKTKRTKKYFVNAQESKDNGDELAENIFNQFFADTQLLFLPAFLAENPTSIKDVSQKIINANKINILSFTNLPTLGEKTINGKILLTNKGEIKSIFVDNTEYNTSLSKDIGGGILLPTKFEGQNSYRFQTVAAFTQVEIGKFTNL